MKQFNIKNIALAAVLMCSVGDAFAAATAAVGSVESPTPPRARTSSAASQGSGKSDSKEPVTNPEIGTLRTAINWTGEHLKTLLAGCTTAVLLAAAGFATFKVQRIKKKLKPLQSTRNSTVMQLRAELNNWIFLRNLSWIACAAAGVLTAWGTVHHINKDADWATSSEDKSSLAKFGRFALFYNTKPVDPTSGAGSESDLSKPLGSGPGGEGGGNPSASGAGGAPLGAGAGQGGGDSAGTTVLSADTL
ncbi:MAG: hypothetical protein WCJ17_00120 [bacterium]